MKQFVISIIWKNLFFLNCFKKPFTLCVLLLVFLSSSTIRASENELSKEKNNNAKTDIQQQITGTVTDAAGVPLPGVSIIIVGTTRGTSTDFDGNYSINANAGDQLQFSYLGFTTLTQTVGTSNVMNVSLEESNAQLDEIVVIGYGTRQKRDVVSSISNLPSEEITKQVVMSPELAMQGKMAGVFISNPGSDPNARPNILIRGAGTLGFTAPLYVIDGIPVYEGGAGGSTRDQNLRGPVNIMNLINPNDIESISVLKDAAALAIYGIRAANGVILIETKRGKAGKPKVNITSSYGFQSHRKRYDVLNTQEYVDLYNEAWENNTSIGRDDDDYGTLFDPSHPDYLGNNGTYNWMDEVVNVAPIQDHSISVSGGSDGSTFSIGLGYSAQDNVVFSDSFERYSLSINSDHKLTNWFKIGETLRVAHTRSNRENGMSIEDATLINPWQPIFDPNDPIGYAQPGRMVDGSFDPRGYGNSTRSNIFGVAPYRTNRVLLNRILGSVYAEITPIKNFRVRGSFNIDYFTNKGDSYEAPSMGLYEFDEGAPLGESAFYALRNTENLNVMGELLFGYANSFGKHNVDVIFNVSKQKLFWDIDSQSILQSNTFSFDQRRIMDGLSPELYGSFTERNRSAIMGYLGRLSYNYDNKYYLDATIRKDGTSKFHPDYRWDYYPGVAVAWRVSSEPFMENATWLNDLKIRASWGQLGNQDIGPRSTTYLSLLNFNPLYALGNNGQPGQGNFIKGSFLPDFPIIDTSWEVITTKNIGFDAVLFDNKLNFTAEYYERLTEKILQPIQIPDVIGALNNPVANIASVNNTGFEFQLGYNDRFGELGFNATANLTTNRNRVFLLNNGRPVFGQGGRIEVGYPIGYIYGYQTDGIFQTQQEVDDWLATTQGDGNTAQLSPGDYRFKDLYSPSIPEEDGEFAYRRLGPDGIVNGLDQTYLGKTLPGYFYGFSLGFDYHGFDASFNFRGLGDVQKINSERRAGIGITTGGTNNFREVLNRWTPTNTDTDIPRAVAGDPSGNNRLSDRWVEDASFLRLQNMQFGYNFNENLLNTLNLSNLRVFASFSNVFVLTDYSGLDPEDDTTPSSIVLGVNLGF